MKIFTGIDISDSVLGLDDFRLFCTARKFKTDPLADPAFERQLIRSADSALAAPIPALPASAYLEFEENGNRTHYEVPCFERRRMMLYLAAGCMYDPGRYSEKLIDVIWEILNEETWVVPAHNNQGHTGRPKLDPDFKEAVTNLDLFSAVTGACMAFALEFAKKALDARTKIISERIKYELDRRIIKPFLRGGQWWQGDSGKRINNWSPWIVSNVLAAAALTVNDSSIRLRCAKRGMLILSRFASFYGDDGGCDEGPGYWEHAGAALFDSLEILTDMTGGSIDFSGGITMRRMGEYIVKMHIDRNYYVNCGDCSPRLSHDSAMIKRWGAAVGSETMQSFADYLAVNEKDRFCDLFSSPEHSKDIFSPYRLFRDRAREYVFDARDFSHLDFYCLPDLQIINMRSKNMFVSVKGGNNGESHNHCDVGNIIVFIGGAPLFIDAGVDTYTKSTFAANERYKLWYMTSAYHNVPDFDGAKQYPGTMYAAKDIKIDRDACRVSLDLDGAYSCGDGRCGIELCRRCVEFNGGALHILDSIDNSAERGFSVNFLCAVKPVKYDDCYQFALDNGLRARISIPQDAEPEYERIDISGTKLEADWQRPELYRIRFRVKAKSANLLFEIKEI